MEQLVVRWTTRALQKFDSKALWYMANCGDSFAKSFARDIQSTLATISHMPGIGVERKRTSRRIYRLYHNHPHCTVYYSYDDNTLTVIDLIFTEMAYRP